jgi:hypothetical protein
MLAKSLKKVVPMILIRPDGGLEEPEDDVALGRIKSGASALHLDQPAPPFAIINLLEVLAGDIARLGPSRAEPEKLDKVNAKLFKDQIKQNLVGGQTVSWRPRAKLEQELFDRLFRTNDGTNNIYDTVKSIWLHRLERIEQIEEHHTALSAAEQLECGLAQVRMGRRPKAHNPNAWISAPPDLGERWQYKEVGCEWVRFELQFIKVRKTVEETKRLACEQARILVSEFHNGIERIVEPERALDVLHKRTRRPEFVFSADLPLIFHDQREVGALVGEARKWMEKVSKLLEEEDKLARKEDMISVAVERSRMTDTAARTAYNKADVRNKGSKRLSSEAYISIKKLRSLIP